MKPSIDADKSGSVFVFYPFRRTEKKEVCRNENFGTTPFRCVRMSKMQGAEDEDDRSLLT